MVVNPTTPLTKSASLLLSSTGVVARTNAATPYVITEVLRPRQTLVLQELH